MMIQFSIQFLGFRIHYFLWCVVPPPPQYPHNRKSFCQKNLAGGVGQNMTSNESDLVPLFHPLSAISLKETTLSGWKWCHKMSQNALNHAPLQVSMISSSTVSPIDVANKIVNAIWAPEDPLYAWKVIPTHCQGAQGHFVSYLTHLKWPIAV